MIDFLSFGEALVDFFPPRPGIPLRDCEVFHRHLGGAPANVAVGLARQGVRAALMTLVGPDEFGIFVRERLEREGIDVRGVGRHARAKTGVTFVSVSQNGDRSFLFFRHPSADQMISVDDVDAALIAEARVVHVGSSTLSREPARAATWKAIEAARASGRLISTDPNLRLHLWEDANQARAQTRALVAAADVVKVAEDELRPIVDSDNVEEGARRLRALGPTLVVVTLGARGCYFSAPCGSGFFDGERVEVVDTTGAGDGFVAGMWSVLLPILDGKSLADLTREECERSLTFANHLGALVVTQLGATTALPLASLDATSRA